MARSPRRAAAASAAALSAAAMRSASKPSSDADACYASLLSSPAYRAAPGHLGLARSHPSLLGRDDLAALLTPEAFLLDATHALAAAALCARQISGEWLRQMRCDPGRAAEFMDRVGPDVVWSYRVGRALYDAKDGRFDDALDAFARLAAERPCDPGPPLTAAGICYLADRLEEGNKWVSGIPETINMALWAKVADGDMSFLKRRILITLLRCVVADKHKGYYKDMVVAGDPSKE
ncbi:hypothetical protein HU200_015645 [Digitaria exilis]|uniref:Uncharacterized protein n=1 Tax=Digitaria exilis TaxID=1010633 RepID=A0A835KL51_9POAL|nr:hypothetical protein HU200_015645 [Digitaria exilis]